MSNKTPSRLSINALNSSLKNITQIHTEGDTLIFQLGPSEKPLNISSSQREKILISYSKWIKEKYSRLPTAGMPLPQLGIQQNLVNIELDEIFIRLRAVRPRPDAEITLSNKSESYSRSINGSEILRAIIQSLKNNNNEKGKTVKENQETEFAQDNLIDSDNRVIDPEAAINDYRFLVLIGGPGSGKSTLMRHIAWRGSYQNDEFLNLLVHLGRLDVRMSESGLSFIESALELLTDHLAGAAKLKLRAVLLWLISEKKVRFLLDGLDEVHSHLQDIRDAIESLRAEGHRLLVTSRPTGYTHLGGFNLFEVLPLVQSDAQAFTYKWFKALAIAKKIAGKKYEEWVSNRANWLEIQLVQRPALQELAQVPLFLTFLVILAGDDPQMELPRKRVDLFKVYIERLITGWEVNHRGRKKLTFGEFSGEEANNFAQWGLFNLALSLHQAFYGNVVYEIPTRSELAQKLGNDINITWKIPKESSGQIANQLIQFWQDAGILELYHIGDDEWLSFRHLTFQEYGAARMLSLNFHDAPEKLWWQHLRYYVQDSQWAEVIPLTLAHLPEKSCDYIFRQLLFWEISKPASLREEYLDPFLFREYEFENRSSPLLIAAKALADGSKSSRELQYLIVFKLLAVIERDDNGHYAFDMVQGNLPSLSLISDTFSRFEPGSNGLFELIKISKNVNLPSSTKKEIGKILSHTGEKQVAKDILIGVVNDVSATAREKLESVELLYELGFSTQSLDFLREITRDTNTDIEDSLGAAEALIRYGNRENGVNILLGLSKNVTIDEKYKLEVARNLINYVDGNKGHQLASDVAKKRIAEAKTRIKATELLWKIGDKNQALDVLEYLAADQTISTDDRWNAIETLARLFSGEKIINILIDTAKDNSMSIPYRCKAIDTLASIGQVDLSIALLSDFDNIQIKGQEQLIIAELFCRLGVEEKGTSIAQKVLRTINTDFNVQLKAIEILGKTSARSDAILWLLEQMKNSATSINQRWAIVRIIVDLGWQNLVSDTLKELSVDRRSFASTEFTNLLKMAKDEDLFSLLKKDESNYGLQLEIVYILIRRGKINEMFEFLQSFIQNERILAVSRLDAASVFIATYQNDAAITNVVQRIFNEESSSAEAKRRALWMLFETSKNENLLEQHLRLLEDPNLRTSTKLNIFEDLFLLDEKDKTLKVLIKFSKDNLDENTLWFCIEKIRLYGHRDDLVTYLNETIEIILNHNSTDRKENLSLYWEIMGVYSSVVDKPLVLKKIGEHSHIASELSLSTRLPALLFKLGFTKEAGTAYQTIANNPSIKSKIRGDAISALIKLGFTEEAKTVLVELSESNDIESGSSIQTASMLALLGDETRASQILNVVVSTSTNKKEQTRAIAVLSRLGRVNELKKICYDLSMDATLRLQSAQALSDIGEIKLAEEVYNEIAQAENITPEIRYQATRNLILLDKFNEATTWLIGIIKTSKKEVRVVANCLNTIKQLGGKEYIRSIALDTTLAPELRVEALKVLSTYHESKEIISILDNIVSENFDKPSIVISAADIASSIDCILDAESYLKKSINEANISRSRKELVQKLQKLDRGNALADIILDEHFSQDLKEITFECIKNIKSVTVFHRLIKSESIKFEWRIQIAEILGNLGDQEAVFTFLTPMLDNYLHSSALRLQAAVVLLKFRETDNVKSFIEELLSDTTIDPEIRKSALQKLQNYRMTHLIDQAAFRLTQNHSDHESLREYAVDLLHTNSPEKLLLLVRDESASTNIRLKSAFYIAKDSVESNGISDEVRDVLIKDGIKGDAKTSLSLDVADLLKKGEFKDAASNICFVILQKEITDKERQRAINLLSKLNQLDLLKELASKVDAINTRFEVANALSNLGDQDSASLILTDILRGIGSKTQRIIKKKPQPGENQVSEKSFDILVKDHRDNDLKKLAYSAWLDPKIRLRSAQAMVNLGNYFDAIDALKYIARDLTVDLSLRVEAALGLGELNITDIAVDAAKQLFRDPKISDDVSRKAAVCLIKYSPSNGISTVLESKYLSANSKLAIARALVELNQSDYGISICAGIAFSENEDLEVRKKSITLLKEIKAQNIIDEILRNHNVSGSVKYFALVPIDDAQKDKLLDLILDIGLDETATTVQRFALGEYLLEHEAPKSAYDVLKKLATSSKAPTSGLLGKIKVQPEKQSVDLIASANQIDTLKEIWGDSSVNVDIRFHVGQKLIEMLDKDILDDLVGLLGDTEKDITVRQKSAMLLKSTVVPDDVGIKEVCIAVLKEKELKQDIQDICVELVGKYSLESEAVNIVGDKSLSIANRLKLSRHLTIKTNNHQWLIEIVKEILHQNNSQEGNRDKKIKTLAIDYLEELKLFSFLAEISLDRSIGLDIRSYALIKAINLIASKDQVQLLLPLLEDNELMPENRLSLLLALQKVGYNEDVPKKIYEFTLLVTIDDEEVFERVPSSNNSSKQPAYIVPAVNRFPSYIESAINALGKSNQTEILNRIVVDRMLALRTRYLAISQLIEAGAKPDAPLEFWIELAIKEKPFYIIEKRTTKDIRTGAAEHIINYDKAILYNIASNSSFDVSYRISIIKELVDSSSPSDLLKIIDGISSEKTPDRLEIAHLYTLLGESQKAIEHYLYILLNPVKQARLQLSPLSSLTRDSSQPIAQPYMTSVEEIMRLGNENTLLEIANNSVVDGNVREYIIDKLESTKNKDYIDLLVSIARRTDFDSVARKNAMIRLVENGFASDAITIGSEIIKRNQGDQSLRQNVVDVLFELHEIDALKNILHIKDVHHEIKIYIIKRLISTSDAEEYSELLLQYTHDTSLSAYNRLQAVIVLLNIKDFDDPVELIFSSVSDANPNSSEFKELSKIFFELLTNYKVNWYDLIFDGRKNLYLRNLMIDRVKDKILLRNLAVDQSLNKIIRLTAATQCRDGKSSDVEIDSIIKQFISDHEVDVNTRLSIANDLLVKKNPDLAREGFKSVANESSVDNKIRAKAAAETAKINFTLKEYENAEKFYLLAIKLGEKSAEIHLNLGNAYLQQKKHKNAIASYMHALELNPAWKDIFRGIGDSHFHIEEYEDAVRFYNKYINEYKKDTIYVWNNLALSNMALGNYDDATTAYLKIIELSPTGVDNLEKVVQGFMGLGRYQEAENFLEKALQINANFQHKYYEYLGKLRFWQQDIGNSIKYLQLAIETDPSCQSAPVMLAQILFLSGKEKDAWDVLQKITITPVNQAMIQWQVGMFYFNQGRFGIAKKHIEEALRIDSQYPDQILAGIRFSYPGNKVLFENAYGIEIKSSATIESYMCLSFGSIFGMTGLPDIAIKYLKKALKLNPKNLEAKSMLNEIFSRRPGIYKTLRKIREVFAFDILGRFSKNKAEQSLLNLYDYYFQIKDFDYALYYIDWTLKLFPQNSRYHSIRGMILRRLERYPDAMKSFDVARKLDPNNIDYHLSWVSTARINGLYSVALQGLQEILINEKYLDKESLLAVNMGLASVYDHLKSKEDFILHVSKAKNFLQNASTYDLACLESIQHNVDKSIEFLSEAAQAEDFNIEWCLIDPDLENVRKDPRFGPTISRQLEIFTSRTS